MRLGLALRHEEYRCQFLSSEARIMLAAHDEVAVIKGFVFVLIKLSPKYFILYYFHSTFLSE